MTSATRFSACAGAANADIIAARLNASAAPNDSQFFIRIPRPARRHPRRARTVGLVGQGALPVQSGAAARLLHTLSTGARRRDEMDERRLGSPPPLKASSPA
jgi:hypothetical protein